MVNYITEAEFRAFTKQNFNGTITSNLYTYSTTISPTEIVNATSDIQRYLIISNTHKDLKGNEPKSFVYTYVAKMIVEEYYYTSASESINNINTFTNNMVPIQFLPTDDGYKKFVCEIGSTPQYVYLVLENTDMPALMVNTTARASEFTHFSEYNTYSMLDTWVKSCSYWRLQSIRLGYKLPKEWLRKVGITSASLSLEGRNLLVVASNYDNYLDPETMGNPFAQPIPRSYIFGINLNF